MSLMTLPTEIRRRILYFTDIVVRPGNETDSLTIVEGHVDTAASRFSPVLFYTCKTLSQEAREVCFSCNRFRFVDEPESNLTMLRKQPEHLLSRIREVEYVFYESDLMAMGDEDEPWIEQWVEMIEFIGRNLKLENLVLSIDASRPYLDWVAKGYTNEDVEDVFAVSSYQAITNPLKQLTDLKSLFLYWPVYHDIEAVVEREIMGKTYDAYQHGKAMLKDRAPGHPRGWNFQHNRDIGIMGNYDEAK